MCLSILWGSVHLYLSMADILKEEIRHFVYQQQITYRSFLKINARNTIEGHGGGGNTLHGVIIAPLKITYTGREPFGTSCP